MSVRLYASLVNERITICYTWEIIMKDIKRKLEKLDV